MKPAYSDTLPIHCPHCERTVHIAITKLLQSVVGVICTDCRKSIPVTPGFLAAIRDL